MQEIRFTLLKNYANKVSVDDLANECGLSKSRFFAVYKSTFNTSPINDVINKRIDTAKQLLLYGKKKILAKIGS
jgi:AraC-like DNA-binding protein